MVKTAVKEVDPCLSIHDFRMTVGEKSVNLIFDLLLPSDCNLTAEGVEKLVVDKIHEISDAEVILLSMYNPVDEVVGKLGDAEMPIGELIGKVMKGMSKYALGYAARHSDNTTYVDIYDTESNLDRYLNEKSNVIEAMEFGSIYAGADNHATAEGHSYIAEQIYNALDLVKDEPIVNPFKDVAEKDYFFKPVMWAVQNGVTTGTSATTFSPNSTVTRGQAVTFLWRAAGEPTPKTTKNPFTDVKKSDYFYEAVLWAVENGITMGTRTNEFSPKNTCSTAHIVTFIYRTLGIGSDGWYKEAAAWAEQEGLLTGTGANVLPREDCPRANVVTFIYRAYK